jgi:hypothetical protein
MKSVITLDVCYICGQLTITFVVSKKFTLVGSNFTFVVKFHFSGYFLITFVVLSHLWFFCRLTALQWSPPRLAAYLLASTDGKFGL